MISEVNAYKARQKKAKNNNKLDLRPKPLQGILVG